MKYIEPHLKEDSAIASPLHRSNLLHETALQTPALLHCLQALGAPFAFRDRQAAKRRQEFHIQVCLRQIGSLSRVEASLLDIQEVLRLSQAMILASAYLVEQITGRHTEEGETLVKAKWLLEHAGAGSDCLDLVDLSPKIKAELTLAWWACYAVERYQLYTGYATFSCYGLPQDLFHSRLSRDIPVLSRILSTSDLANLVLRIEFGVILERIFVLRSSFSAVTPKELVAKSHNLKDQIHEWYRSVEGAEAGRLSSLRFLSKPTRTSSNPLHEEEQEQDEDDRNSETEERPSTGGEARDGSCDGFSSRDEVDEDLDSQDSEVLVDTSDEADEGLDGQDSEVLADTDDSYNSRDTGARSSWRRNKHIWKENEALASASSQASLSAFWAVLRALALHLVDEIHHEGMSLVFSFSNSTGSESSARGNYSGRCSSGISNTTSPPTSFPPSAASSVNPHTHKPTNDTGLPQGKARSRLNSLTMSNSRQGSPLLHNLSQLCCEYFEASEASGIPPFEPCILECVSYCSVKQFAATMCTFVADRKAEKWFLRLRSCLEQESWRSPRAQKWSKMFDLLTDRPSSHSHTSRSMATYSEGPIADPASIAEHAAGSASESLHSGASIPSTGGTQYTARGSRDDNIRLGEEAQEDITHMDMSTLLGISAAQATTADFLHELTLLGTPPNMVGISDQESSLLF